MARISGKFKFEFCKEVVELGKQGKTVSQMAAHIGVSRQTLYNWCKESEPFAAALDLAKTYTLAHHEQTIIDLAKGVKKGNIVGSIVLVKALAPEIYNDKHISEITVKSDVEQMSNDELNKKLLEEAKNIIPIVQQRNKIK